MTMPAPGFPCGGVEHMGGECCRSCSVLHKVGETQLGNLRDFRKGGRNLLLLRMMDALGHGRENGHHVIQPFTK